MSRPVIELGTQLPYLRIWLRRRSAQGWTLTIQRDGQPLDLGTTPVILEVDRTASWVGSVDGATITWQLDKDQTDLPLGVRGVTLVQDPDGARNVWLRGQVDVQ